MGNKAFYVFVMGSITATLSHSLSQSDTCDEMYWGQRHCPLLLPLYTFAVYGILIGSLAW